jgi:hypothetical protein
LQTKLQTNCATHDGQDITSQDHRTKKAKLERTKLMLVVDFEDATGKGLERMRASWRATGDAKPDFRGHLESAK